MLKRSRRDGKNIQKNCIKKILINQITRMVWSVTQNQTFWCAKSSGPEEALLLIKLVDAMKFQQNYSNPQRMMQSRFFILYDSKSGRPSSDHRTEKIQSSSQFPGRAVPKHVPTIGQSHSFPRQVRSCLKPCMLGFSIMQTKNCQMSKLVLEKELERNQRSNCQHQLDYKAREFQ